MLLNAVLALAFRAFRADREKKFTRGVVEASAAKR